MRQILVDRARARLRLKRGGGGTPVTFDEALMAPDAAPEQVVELDDALQALHSMDPRKAKIVELRYFGGLSVEETAEVMELSTATVGREMRLARAWLLTQLAG